MVSLANAYGIPVVGLYDRKDVASDDEKEGTVVRWASGAMAKQKSEIYVRKHRSKDLVTKFKELVALIVDDDLDDVIPQLDNEIKMKVLSYKDELLAKMTETAGSLGTWVKTVEDLDQKTFAGAVKETIKPKIQPIVFNARKSGDSFEEIKRCIKRSYGDTTKLTDLFEELELPVWAGDFFSE
jgi:hypothetical protein